VRKGIDRRPERWGASYWERGTGKTKMVVQKEEDAGDYHIPRSS